MPFGIYNAASRFGLPDFGISERFSGYTTPRLVFNDTNKALQSSYNTVKPKAVTVQPNPTYVAGGIDPQGTPWNLRGGNPIAPVNSQVNYGPSPVGAQLPAPKVTVNTGKVATNNGTTNTTGTDYSKNADYLGRFESYGPVNSPARNAAYEAYLKTKSVTGESSNAPDLATQERNALSQNVNSQYDSAVSYINELENQLKGNEQQYYDIAGNPYDAQRPLLDQARGAALDRNALDVQNVKQSREDALSQSRRLFHELSQGNQQRYGGTSSAGEFAQALQGRQLQQNQAQATQTTQQNLSKLYEHANEVESQYQAQLQQLEKGKQDAIVQARLDFQSKLQDLNNKRMSLGQNKQQMELQILQEFYQNRQQIEAQTKQLGENLRATATQARLNLQNAMAQYQANNDKPIDISAIPQSSYDAINQQVYANNPEIYQGFLKRQKQLGI